MKIKKSARKLKPLDHQILKFLWRWKVANTLTLKTYLAPEISFWTVYWRIMKLKNESYIDSVGGNESYVPSVWQLTKKGFGAIESEIGELSERRYKPHSVPHDAWVLAFHLGEFVHGVPSEVAICTEQQFRSFDKSLLPDWLPKDKAHVPDGFTRTSFGKKPMLYGIEVELHAKPIERYNDVFNYYDDEKKVDQILWLVSSEYIQRRMLERLYQIDIRRRDIHNFLLLEDFKKNGWNATINHGRLTKASVKSLMLQTNQLPPNYRPVTGKLPQGIQVFLANAQSPKLFVG